MKIFGIIWRSFAVNLSIVILSLIVPALIVTKIGGENVFIYILAVAALFSLGASIGVAAALMRTTSGVGKFLYCVLCLIEGAVTTAIVSLPGLLDMELVAKNFLIIFYIVAYLLSFSTAMRMARRVSLKSRAFGKAIAYVIFTVLNVALAPITLVISIFGRTKRMYNLNDYVPADFDADSAEAKEARLRDRIKKKEDEIAAKNARRKERFEKEKERLLQLKLKAEEKKIRIETDKAELELQLAKEAAKNARDSAKAAAKASKSSRAAKAPVYANSAPTASAAYRAQPTAKTYEPKQKKISKKQAMNDEINAGIRASVWRSSSKQAIEKILDDSYKGDVKIFDGVDTQVFKQVALIKLSARQYALLAPKNPESESYGMAVAYAIAPEANGGDRVLVRVEDEGLYRKIYAVYESLLQERGIFAY